MTGPALRAVGAVAIGLVLLPAGAIAWACRTLRRLDDQLTVW